MKRQAFAVILSSLAAPALADGPAAPIIEPEVVVAETAAGSASDDWVVIALTLAVFGAALAQ